MCATPRVFGSRQPISGQEHISCQGCPRMGEGRGWVASCRASSPGGYRGRRACFVQFVIRRGDACVLVVGASEPQPQFLCSISYENVERQRYKRPRNPCVTHSAQVWPGRLPTHYGIGIPQGSPPRPERAVHALPGVRQVQMKHC